jgi:choline dehydrogenase
MGANDLITLGSNWPNIEFLMLPAYYNPAFPNPPNATGNYLTVIVALVSPTSMGNVTIGSTNINDPPIIDTSYLSTTDDQKVAIQGLKNAFAVAQSTAFEPVFLGRDKVFPSASVSTDGQILDYVRKATTTVWHASGTAAMMRRASGGVVDSLLRVHGIQNLRIVDASIQPRISNHHVQAAVYMIAERAGDFLKAKYER